MSTSFRLDFSGRFGHYSAMALQGGVREYYDSNTRGFLRFGGASARTGSIHRSLRLPGVRTSTQAIHAIHHVLYAQLLECGIIATRSPGQRPAPGTEPLVADLGCGVGASMSWLLRNTDVQTAGITVSALQARIAAGRLPARARVVEGSFTSEDDLRRMTGGRSIDAAYMIESFVHTDEPENVFRALGRLTAAGGVLIICDDIPTDRLLRDLRLSRALPTRERRQRVRLHQKLAADFRAGWHINGFQSVRQIAEIGLRTGWRLARTVDLSEYVVTTRPRDFIARIAYGPARSIGARGSWWENVIGGSALQRLIRRRLIRYQILVLERVQDRSLTGTAGQSRRA